MSDFHESRRAPGLQGRSQPGLSGVGLTITTVLGQRQGSDFLGFIQQVAGRFGHASLNSQIGVHTDCGQEARQRGRGGEETPPLGPPGPGKPGPPSSRPQASATLSLQRLRSRSSDPPCLQWSEGNTMSQLTSPDLEDPLVAVHVPGRAGQLLFRVTTFCRQADWTLHGPRDWGGERGRKA